MSGDFDVFDEWGNLIGKFTPRGSGCLDTIALILVLLLLWTIGFFIYLLIKLTINGFKALLAGKWGQALINLAIPGILGLSACFLIVSGTVNAIAQQQQKQSFEKAYEQEIQWVKNNPDKVMTFTRINSVCNDYIDPCEESNKKIYVMYGKYEIVNNLHYISLELNSKECENLRSIEPNGTITVYCKEQIRQPLEYGAGYYWETAIPCIEAYIYGVRPIACTDLTFARGLNNVVDFRIQLNKESVNYFSVEVYTLQDFDRDIGMRTFVEDQESKYFIIGDEKSPFYVLGKSLPKGTSIIQEFWLNYEVSRIGKFCVEFSARGYVPELICKDVIVP